MSDASKAVFLSYASQDADAARGICEALRAAEVEVWLDQDGGLVGGDAWDAKIRGQIASCALFVPIISSNTQARGEGYFRLEWKLAAQRTHMMSERTAFLLPVVIDATSDAEADVPAEFRAVQWTRLKDGVPSSPFVERVKTLLGGDLGARSRDGGTASASSAGKLPARAGKRIRPGLFLAISAAVALAIWQPWRRLAPSAPATQDKSIAVLPFVNQSDDKENTAFFSDGMHEDILTNLANIRDLRVVSRTSVMDYRDTKKKIPQIAQELGVAYILEGSVRRAGNQVKITGQLIRAANDRHLWAKSYERELTPKEVFAIQAALATEIAGELKATLSPQEKSTLARIPTQNLDAYDLFLKAREVRNRSRYVPSAFQEREMLLQRAVKLDPNFASAWSELSRVQGFTYYRGFDMTEGRRRQAKDSIDRAVRLAPETPDVIKDLGSYYFTIDRDYDRAIEHYQRVLRLVPNDADAHRVLSNAKVRIGDWAGGTADMQRAVELDPGDLNLSRALVTRFLAGRRYGDARSVQSRLVKLLPDAPVEAFELAYISFLADGSTAEVDAFLAQSKPEHRDSPRMIFLRKTWAATRGELAEFRRLDQRQPSFEDEPGAQPTETMLAAMVLANTDPIAARARLKALPVELKSRIEREPTNYWPWGALARVEAMLGNREEALRCAQRAAGLVNETDKLSLADTANALAFVHLWTGQPELALAEYARQITLPNQHRTWVSDHAFTNVHEMRLHPAFAPLRNDPRFHALLNDPKNNQPLF